MRDRTGLVYVDSDNWVYTNGKIFKYTDWEPENIYSRYIHRATCDLLDDIPWIGDASPPEVAAGWWWDRLITVKSNGKPFDAEHPTAAHDILQLKGTPFEILSQTHINEPGTHDWLTWDFCPECCPDDIEDYAKGDFVKMLNLAELASALDYVADCVVNGEGINFSWSSIWDLLTVSANQMRKLHARSIDVVDPTHKEK